MKLHDIERALKKFTSIAQVAGRKLKEKQQQAAEADEKAHQAKMKFKHARREFKGAARAGNSVPRRTKGNRPPQPELSFKLKPLAEVSKRKA